MQMSGIVPPQQPHSHSTSATSTPKEAVTSGSMNDDDTQQQQHHGSGTDMAMMEDDPSNPSSSNNGSSSSIGIGSVHTPTLNVDPSATHPIDETHQSGHGGPSAAAALSASSVSESTSSSVEHEQRGASRQEEWNRSVNRRGCEYKGSQWPIIMMMMVMRSRRMSNHQQSVYLHPYQCPSLNDFIPMASNPSSVG